MKNPSEVDELSAKRICHKCIGETYLSSEIKISVESGVCDYCGETRASLTLDDFADRIQAAFAEHYTRTPDHPDFWEDTLLRDREISYVWMRHGVPVRDAIEGAANISTSAAADVLAILERRNASWDKDDMGRESEFAAESYYEERDADNLFWHIEWFKFAQSLKTEARFFSHSAVEHLARVFGGIDRMKTAKGRRVVVKAGPGTAIPTLHRARVFQADDALETALRDPAQHLGSPPATLARAGRMNAQGISVFYGTRAPGTAIAEVRAPVGSRVAVAQFRIIRPLLLLDLTALDNVAVTGSIFDALFKGSRARATFLRTLGTAIARPIMPDDEALNYLPTQAVADFLATMNTPRLDGIIFTSAQVLKGRNVVLFHDAALVRASALPEGTKVSVSLGRQTADGWEDDYSVVEEVPPPEPAPGVAGEDAPGWHQVPTANPLGWDDEVREPTLEIVSDSVKVFHIKAVTFVTRQYDVRRHRSGLKKPKF